VIIQATFHFTSSRHSMQSTLPNWNSTISFSSLPVTSRAASLPRRHVADDHQVAADLFKRLFRCGNLILWPEARSLYEPSPEHLGQQFPGLLRPYLPLCQTVSTTSSNGRRKSATRRTSSIPLSVKWRCGSSSDFDSPCCTR
jgi:hypothetical protein